MFLTIAAHRAACLRWCNNTRINLRKECFGAKKHVECFDSQVESMSDFWPPWPFSTLAAEDNVDQV
jgi:hypothetical protein